MIFEKVFRICLLILGGGLVADTLTLMVFRIGSVNFGTIMPIIIGMPLLIVAIFFTPILNFFCMYTIGKLIKIGMITVYILFIALFAFTTVLANRAARAKLPENLDVLIVLGCGIRGENVSKLLANRLETACEYLENNPETVCIVSGGKGKDEAVSEAFAMRKYLLQRGIANERIIMEDNSYSTLENFKLSAKLIPDADNKEIGYVTTDFHVFRAGLTAKKAGIKTIGTGAPDLWYLTVNNYLRECAAITQYYMFGKI